MPPQELASEVFVPESPASWANYSYQAVEG